MHHHGHLDAPDHTIGRRHLLLGAGAGIGAIAASAAVAPGAAASVRDFPGPPAALPKPIAFQVDSGDPRVGNIHWALPGPPGASTPVLGIPSFGFDADPSTIGDFHGFVAHAVVSGQAQGCDGEDYLCELDIRAMEGEYVAEDGTMNRAAFAFV